MLQDHLTSKQAAPAQDEDILRLGQAGRQIGKSAQVQAASKQARSALERQSKATSVALQATFRPENLEGADGRWLSDNYRLILTAQKETRQLAASFSEYRTATLDSAPERQPLPYVVAKAYLGATFHFVSEQGLVAFLQGFQESVPLEMGELWALKPALQHILVERISTVAVRGSVPLAVLITSLRTISELEWKDLFETVSSVNAILKQDPAGCYARMDYFSRDYYRNQVAALAKCAGSSEQEVAQTAVRLASEARTTRGSHAGFWLLDGGLPVLRDAVGYRPKAGERIRNLVRSWPQSFYLIGVELITLVLAFTILDGFATFTPTLLALVLLILPVTQAAVDIMNNLTSFLVKPRVLPKLDFSEGIPAEHATLVAVPTLLLNEKQVRQLAMDLEIRFLANRDPNLYFSLVTDSPDSDHPQADREELVDLAISLIDGLNHRYGADGRTPFFLFHRHLTYNASEGRWMGWERKRGKLLDLNQVMRGGFDSFPVKVGDTSVLPSIKYVLTLDSDTQLPRGVAHKLVGTIAHPLHRPVVDPATKMVVAGYGILQPRIGISIDSAASSRLASIYSGQTGFDIYTRAVSDVYQDLFGEGIFTGKGIYDVDAVRDSVEHRFPENALLSHDLIEGVYARAGLVSDVELIDDYPSHFSAYSRRKHRWVRGDWQIMRWLRPRVPNFEGKVIPNPISLISRWKVLDNLRRSLIEPATLALILAGWFFLNGDPVYWTCASLALLLTPVYAGLFFSLLRAPLRSPTLKAWVKDTAAAFVQGHVFTLLQVVFLLHQSMLSLDAIARSVLRVWFTKTRLLEWETAAEAENAQRRTATVDVYLSWSPVLVLLITGLLWLLRPAALPVAAPVLALWFLARYLSAWLNRAPRGARGRLREDDIRFLRASAARSWRYFREWSNPGSNWLIPDNVREDGLVANRLSPTNLGFLLNARIAAVHFGYLTVAEFVGRTRETLATLEKLPKYRGHLFNWYDTQNLRALHPRFVSTVDSGNLAACLLTLKQAALSFAKNQIPTGALETGIADIRSQAVAASEESDSGYWQQELEERIRQQEAWQQTGLTDQLISELREIASDCDRLVADMDFNFLLLRRKKVLSIGCDADTAQVEPSGYDLLASEARIASFVAIAKGDAPQESWFHLGRRHTLFAGQRVLVSWTGTMFEYLMPALWMKHYRNTIMHDSLRAVVRVQQQVVRGKRIPWGISESGCVPEPSGDYGYHAFGISQIAMKVPQGDSTVVSPYSSFLALLADRTAALRNLEAMDKLGWFGRYGFYEAVDYRGGSPEIIRSWMAHHVGMSLLALCNLLCENPLQNYFHSEPQVLATELLLHERVPNAIVIEEEAPAPPAMAAEAVA